MKEQLRSLIHQTKSAPKAALLIREYLQARILDALQRLGAFSNWVFLGGTALRFIYQLPRFSEDLDFSLKTAAHDKTQRQHSFESFLMGIKRNIEAESYIIDVRSRSEGTVQSACIGFPGLLFELGISGHREEKLSVKIEIDTNPPGYGKTETSLLRRHLLLNLLHYDKATLLSGKLHALLQRPYVKGRDVYDLLWYLSDPKWPEPNLLHLQSSLMQTGMHLEQSELINWRALVSKRIQGMNWNQVMSDVIPFLEDEQDIHLLAMDHVLKLLDR